MPVGRTHFFFPLRLPFFSPIVSIMSGTAVALGASLPILQLIFLSSPPNFMAQRASLPYKTQHRPRDLSVPPDCPSSAGARCVSSCFILIAHPLRSLFGQYSILFPYISPWFVRAFSGHFRILSFPNPVSLCSFPFSFLISVNPLNSPVGVFLYFPYTPVIPKHPSPRPRFGLGPWILFFFLPWRNLIV